MCKRILCIVLIIMITAVLLCGCAKEAMDDTESMIGDLASGFSSSVDSMMGGSDSRIPTDAPTVREETDNPTDGDFGEPNVDDYDDNDSDVIGDENESDVNNN